MIKKITFSFQDTFCCMGTKFSICKEEDKFQHGYGFQVGKMN